MNGYKNYETWNVALFINNDEVLYRLAVDYTKSATSKISYKEFVKYASLDGCKTGDGVSFTSHELSLEELDEMLEDI